jgi:YidC/Oxa1 family membrane protein insertase
MDLSQPERWYGLVGILPSDWGWVQAGIPILAIVVFVTSYFQTKVTATPSTGADDQAASMSKMMSIYIPVLMGWISYTYNAGLAIYFVASNIVSLLQYALMGRLDLSNLFSKKEKAAS